jgi:hypothetical protein
MSDLIPPAELQLAHEKYEQEHPVPETKAEILVRICRSDPTYTVAELAEAAERSTSWVRRILKQAGIIPAKAPRLAKTPAKSSKRSTQATATRKLKRFLHDARAAGVIFRQVGNFFEVEVPDGLRAEDYEPMIRANAEKIFEVLWPPIPSFRRRPKCQICAPKTGCRTTGHTIGNEQFCPICNHTCRAHFAPQHFGDLLNLPTKYDFAGYCNVHDAKGKGCECPGFPVAPKPVKTKKAKVTATQMPLLPAPQQGQVNP